MSDGLLCCTLETDVVISLNVLRTVSENVHKQLRKTVKFHCGNENSVTLMFTLQWVMINDPDALPFNLCIMA